MTEGEEIPKINIFAPLFFPRHLYLFDPQKSRQGRRRELQPLCPQIRTVRFDRATVVFSSAAMVFSPLFLSFFQQPLFIIFVDWISLLPFLFCVLYSILGDSDLRILWMRFFFYILKRVQFVCDFFFILGSRFFSLFSG